MNPAIVDLSSKMLVGKCLPMSLADNQTANLWRSLMPRRMEIQHRASADLISMQVYPTDFDFAFRDLHQPFVKWAAAEVTDWNSVPEGMERFSLPGGLYAVFHDRGLNTDPRIFQYIFGEWLPASDYEIDDRPHFEVLGEMYRNNDPDSEEDIYVPIR